MNVLAMKKSRSADTRSNNFALEARRLKPGVPTSPPPLCHSYYRVASNDGLISKPLLVFVERGGTIRTTRPDSRKRRRIPACSLAFCRLSVCSWGDDGEALYPCLSRLSLRDQPANTAHK